MLDAGVPKARDFSTAACSRMACVRAVQPTSRAAGSSRAFPPSFGGAWLTVWAKRVPCAAARRLARSGNPRGFRCRTTKQAHEFHAMTCTRAGGRELALRDRRLSRYDLPRGHHAQLPLVTRPPVQPARRARASRAASTRRMRDAPPDPRDARRRALGQNFLHDQSVVTEIIGHAAPAARALVVDLGAGAGALTKAAAQDGRRVLAVELDPRLCPLLAAAPAAGGRRGPGRRRAAACRSRTNASTLSPMRRTGSARSSCAGCQGRARARARRDRAARETAHRLARNGRFAAAWAPWFELRVHGPDPAAGVPPRAERRVGAADDRAARRCRCSRRRLRGLRRVPDAVFSGRERLRASRPWRRRDSTLGDPASLPPEAYARLYNAL